VRRLNRGLTLLVALLAALTIAGVTAGCSSSGGSSSGTASSANSTANEVPHGVQETAGYKDGQAMKKCLKSYGLARGVLRNVYYGTGSGPTASEATLAKAGENCWHPGYTGLFASALKRIVNCLGLEGVHPAASATPLAAVLTAFDVHTSKARSALKFCLRS
jgi:hypothetical protein